MRFNIVGAGPAGLYFAYLIKQQDVRHDVVVFEQNPSSVTWGFGVVFSDRALEFLRDDDARTCDYLSRHLERWDDITVVHDRARVRIDGNGFGAIGRLHLLELLASRAREAGVVIRYGSRIENVDALADADVVIGADGVNSVVRASREVEFGMEATCGSNRFIWYGTSKPFDTLTLTFRPTDEGVYCAHHYRYRPDMSTFLVEVAESTYNEAGFGDMDEDAAIARCGTVFAEDLGGHSIISNRSFWRRFPVVTNRRWSTGNVVLLGDALRTVHFSIGSGTRLAMEDAIALAKAFGAAGGDVRAALESFESSRRPTTDKLLRAADASLGWYEKMDAHMSLSPYEFAHGYMTRTGRVSHEQLTRIAPRFMSRFRQIAADSASRIGEGE
ncbi:MAG: monooxygenase [Proteobacteria bacterium]|nr:MAG: monooxygenase [Pseudomonadota bacterium]